MEQKVIAAGLMAICPETGRFLMLKRREDMKFPGYWSVPGGFFDEKDGYPKVTALREFREETGYEGVVKISKEVLYLKKDNHLNFYVYVGILPYEFVPNLKGECEIGNESVDYGWFPTTCKWEYDEKVVPSVVTVLDLKKDLLEKLIDKFKYKNY